MQGEAALESLLEAIKDNVDPLDAAPGKRGAEDTPTGVPRLHQTFCHLRSSATSRFPNISTGVRRTIMKEGSGDPRKPPYHELV